MIPRSCSARIWWWTAGRASYSVHDAFSRGEVSYSKVRAMTRVATADNEAYLLMIARHGTAAHVETVVRGYRRVQAPMD